MPVSLGCSGDPERSHLPAASSTGVWRQLLVPLQPHLIPPRRCVNDGRSPLHRGQTHCQGLHQIPVRPLTSAPLRLPTKREKPKGSFSHLFLQLTIMPSQLMLGGSFYTSIVPRRELALEMRGLQAHRRTHQYIQPDSRLPLLTLRLR